MLKSMQRNGLILAGFAVIATFLVVMTSLLTEDEIERQQQQELLRVLNQIIPASKHDNDLYDSCTLISHPDLGVQPRRVYRALVDGQPTAAAMEVTAPNGYSGAIHLLVAMNVDGSVAGVRTLQHQETPGLGDKIELRKNNWILSFNGHRVNGTDDNRWAVKRDGGMFDQFTGATITPRAVVQAVKRAALVFNNQQQAWFNAPANCQAPAGSVVNSTDTVGEPQ
ncbi:electron transport complex subunit RsxG [Pseudidiomarina woesei]|uniref:electron transport complex subunit RsxG n=1 Tax=Pseudidiomarina woesei TaxID=1381080 RepID=UPI0006E2C90D|nr:electron transport complex subunit RsxG [Pseudidiomarina woesei]